MTTNEKIVSFIKQTFNQQDSFIPLHEPRFYGNERKYVLDAIDSTFVSSVGEYVNRFEKMMAETAGTKYAVATVNGTAALHIALLMAGVEKDTEVLTQNFTFVATTNAISYIGATPHIIDIEESALGMSPKKLKERLEEVVEMRGDLPFNKQTGKRISACVPMHTFGFVSLIEEIIEICNHYNIKVVEDAADCIGSTLNGKPAGSFGLLGTFSFNGNKTITCGGGGAIVTNNEALAKRAKHITTTSKVPHKYKYNHDEVAYNYRMPNLNAAMACAQLEMLPEFIQNKRELANLYANFFKELNITFITEREGTEANYWLNAILLNNLEQRDEFLEFTNSNNVMTRPGWELMHTLEMYKDSPKGDLSNSIDIYNKLVNIPSSVRVNN
jgi:aminotransferase in exopolysaccharide biosynthesis